MSGTRFQWAFAVVFLASLIGGELRGVVVSAAPLRPTYLALGDSLAYGMQIGKLRAEIAQNDVTVASFDTGYVDAVAAKLRESMPELQVINYGCPGETTSSFIDGPCGYATSGKPFGDRPLPAHAAYSGAQMTAALAYLAQHPEVTTVTIDVGINDLRAVEIACPDGPNFDRCVAQGWSAARPGTEDRLRDIFARLRSAAPSAKIVALGYYNWLGGVAPGTDRSVEDLDATIASAAARAKIRFASAFREFNRTGDERSHLCDLTLFCGPSHDLHPSDAGYRTIGDLLIGTLKD